MAYVPVSKPSVGDATFKTAFADGIIDNQTYFNSVIGTNAAGVSLIPNGSFEDVTAGVPDGWTETEHSAGTGSVDTATPAHGATAYKFVSAGAPGGGYLETTDFFNCAPEKNIVVDFLLKSSVVDIHNLVQLRWYTEADAFVSMIPVYDDEVANPTSWTRFTRGITPPPTARKAKLRLTGADNDNVTPGTCTFDGVSVMESRVQTVVVNAIATHGWNDNNPDRIKWGAVTKQTSAASATALLKSMTYIEADVAGGVTLACHTSYSAGNLQTVNLVLPEGVWTVTHHWHFESGSDPDDGAIQSSAIAIRQY